MPLNPFFLQGSLSEQRLVQDLVNEHLRMFGQDVLYLPRKIINEKTILKEIADSKFDDSYRIEAYLSNYDGYGDAPDFMSKFGVRIAEEITLVISKERFDDFITPFLRLYPEGTFKLTNRPAEGDLIYFPLDNALFEVKYVQYAVPFYQLNDLYMYELKCELFEYENEVIDIPDIETGQDGNPIIEPIGSPGTSMIISFVGAAASSASATVSYSSTITGVKSLHYIDLIHDGSNYTYTPTVTISKPEVGRSATALAGISTGRVETLTVSDSGFNYINIPSVTFTPPNKPISSQIKFGNNSTYHSQYSDVENSLFSFPSNIDGRNGRLVISCWIYPTQLDPDPDFGGCILWSEKMKIHHLPDGKIRFSSAQAQAGTNNSLILNQWNFIRVVQYNNQATVSLNGSTYGPFSNYDPIPFPANIPLYIGSDANAQGRAPAVTRGFVGYLDHLTINVTTDTSFRTSVSDQIPTNTTEQEIDLHTSSPAQYINAFNNEYPVATAILGSDRKVSSLTLVEKGNGYLNPPNVILSPPSTGRQATAVAIMTSRTGVPNNAIDRILLIDPGLGYDQPPTVTITGGNGSGAIATAVLSELGMGPVAITTGGVGYSTVPTVYVDRTFIPSGVGISSNIRNVSAEAVMDSLGRITQVRYRSAGAGYTSVPTVTFDPPQDPSFGNFTFNEKVTGLLSNTEAYVKSWDYPNRILTLSSSNGRFVIGETIVGAGASYTVSKIELVDSSKGGFGDNDDIEAEADELVDFSERNPFGEV